VERLSKYELTKAEVLMIVNLGLGLEDWKERMPPRLRDGADGVRSAEEQRVSDEWVLGTVCEELEQRFRPEEIQGILKTVGDVMREEERVGRTEADQIEGPVSPGEGPAGTGNGA
jgi:phage host-nuclease inhibitor protein Gam